MATGSSEIHGLLNEHDVARIAGVSVALVRRWRVHGRGPNYLKIGTCVRYRPEDLVAWIETLPSSGGQSPEEAR